MAERIYASDVTTTFEVNPVTRDLGIVRNENALRQQVNAVLTTNQLERPFLPSFGTNIRQYLFDPVHPITALKIEKEIRNALERSVPEVTVESIVVQARPDDNEYLIEVRVIPRSAPPIDISRVVQRLR